MTDTANLEDGFYWVRESGEWVVMEWSRGKWWMTAVRSNEPDEIDPRPIKREE